MTSWAVSYPDLASLKQASELAVAGTILAGTAHLNQSEAPIWLIPHGGIYTDYALSIRQVAWDPHQLVKGASILIRHPGGRIGEIEVKVAGIPPFQPGEEVILFLKRVSPGDPEHFSALGGHPDARFAIQSGLVYPSFAGSGPREALTPLPEAEFLARIQQA